MAREATATASGALTGREPDPLKRRSDEQLLKRFLHGTEEFAEAAFAELIDRHGALVQRVCLDVLNDAHQAQDAAQVVFLVFARKARSIRKPGSLGPWLHGVALRVARRVRREIARRRAAEHEKAKLMRERQRMEVRPGPMDHAELHEEIDRLPDKYRRPIILCYMQGQTQTQAAETLGWPLGTVQIRLHRGRERLRSRLIQRDAGRNDLNNSALLSSLIVPAIAPEPAWSETTAHAAIRLATGRGTFGLVSPAVNALAESTLSTMIYTPFKNFTLASIAAVLAVACLYWSSAIAGFEKKPLPPNFEAVTTGSIEGQPASQLAEQTAPGAIVGKNRSRKSTDIADSQKKALEPAQIVASSESTEQNETFPSPRSSPGQVLRMALLVDHSARTPSLGRELFERVWAPNDPRSHGGDGLGPVFNEQSCVACHNLGGSGGAGGNDRNIEIASLSGNTGQGMGFSYGFSMDFGTGRFEYRIGGGYPDGSSPGGSPEALRGMAAIHPGFRQTQSVLLHRFGTDPNYNLWRQTVLREHGGIQVRVTERSTPPLFGLGLIDAIPDAVIEAGAKRKFSGQPAVKGRVSRLKDGRIGRFGWKAQTAKLEDFVLSAAAGEMGLEVPSRHQASDPRLPGLGALGLDMDQADCDALVRYVRSLPAPVILKPADHAQSTQVRSGEEVFRSIGCTSCHVPKLGEVTGVYSDLLLHDMGTRLADADAYTVFVNDQANGNLAAPATNAVAAPNGPGGGSVSASLREWRTPPLWGLRHSAPYLHDGRAASIEKAIALHGGQGAASAKRYAELSPRRKQILEAFLLSLSAPAAEQ